MDRTRAFSIILALLWLLAFALSLPFFKPYEWARLGSVSCLFVAGGAALAAAIAQGLKQPQNPLMAILLGGFTLLAAASIAWSPAKYISVVGFATLCLLPGSFMLVRLVPDKEVFYKTVAGGGGLLMAGLALWVPVQIVFFPDLLVYGQARHPFSNPNIYAAMLIPGLFGFLGAGMAVNARLCRISAFTVAVLCMVAIILISGRGVMLASLFFLALYFWLLRDRLKNRPKILFILLAAGIGACILPLILGNGPGGERVNAFDRLYGLFAHFGQNVAGRTSIWQGAGDMIADAPLAGTGIGTFFLYYPEYRLPAEIYSAGIMAHNDPLQFWAELGVLAPLLFYGILLVVLRRMLRIARNKEYRTRAEYPLAAALFCGLGGVAAHAHISYGLQVAGLLCLSGLLLGIWANLVNRLEGAEGRRVFYALPSAGAAYALAFIPIVGFLIILQGVLMSEYHAGRAEALILSGDIHGFSQEVNNANRTGFGWNARPYILAASIPLGVLESGNPPAQERKRLAAEAGALLDKAQAANPRLVSIYHYRARLYHLTGNPEEKAELEKALVINPQHLPSRMALADLYAEKGDNEGALQILKQGLSWPYPLNDPFSYYNRVILLGTLLGDEEAAMRAQEKLRQVRRENAAVRKTDSLFFTAPDAAP